VRLTAAPVGHRLVVDDTAFDGVFSGVSGYTACLLLPTGPLVVVVVGSFLLSTDYEGRRAVGISDPYDHPSFGVFYKGNRGGAIANSFSGVAFTETTV